MRNKWTNRSIKDKLVDWFKMPANLLEDPRIEQLIDNEGMKGFGLYIAVICRLYSKRSKCITLKQILSIKENGCSKYTLKRIIHDYELFDIDAYDHVTSRIDYLYFPSKTSLITGKNASTDEASNDIQNEFKMNLECIPTPACVPTKKEKENKKNDYHHSKKSDDAADADTQKLMKKMEEPMKKQPLEEPMPSIYRSEPMEPVVMDPIQYLRSLPIHSAWAEAMLQTLGGTNPALRCLVMSQWEKTKDFLALHMESQAKVSDLLSERDVKRYFTNCLNNATVARKLQDYLAELRAKEIERQQEEMQRRMEEEW